MRHPRRIVLIALLTSIVSMSGLLPVQASDDTRAPTAEALTKGKELTFERGKGNCLACHRVDDGELPGNIGPPLIAMKARFPDHAVLREQIYDARIKNPNTIMPPFGTHGILTDKEIDLITDYIHTL